jgi:hypothetical protein
MNSRIFNDLENIKLRNGKIQMDWINRIYRIGIYPVHPVNPVKIQNQ